MAKAIIILDSQEEYDLYKEAHSILSEEMNEFFEDDDRRADIGEHIIEAIIDIKNPEFILYGNFAEQWEGCGMEDWEWNSLFGAAIVYINPSDIRELLQKVKDSHGMGIEIVDGVDGKSIEIRDGVNSIDEEYLREMVKEEISDSMQNCIPDEIIMEIDMGEYVNDFEGNSDWVKDAVYGGFRTFFDIIKVSAITEAAMLLNNGSN